MDLRPVRNTSLIEIRVYSEKPEEVAGIANAIAETYRHYRLTARMARIAASVQALESDHQANEDKIGNVRVNVAELSRGQNGGNGDRLDQARRRLDELQRFNQILATKIASEKVDLSLPSTSMVEIVDTAQPGLRPVRPNKPFNIFIGNIVGAIGGLFMATLIYVLRRWEFRRISGTATTQSPPRFRAIVHILIALVVGIVVGYHCATPLQLSTIIVVPLTLLFGGIASAYVELARVQLLAESSSALEQTKPTFVAPKY